jgi:hypothetical protein
MALKRSAVHCFVLLRFHWKGDMTMFSNSKLLQAALAGAIVLGGALLTSTSILAAPLHQEEAETPSTPDGTVNVFLPLVSSDGSTEDVELDPEVQPASMEAVQAGTVCKLDERAGVYAYVYYSTPVDKIYTAAAGRGFRVYARTLLKDGEGRYWYYGHSAERPTTNGYVWTKRVRC